MATVSLNFARQTSKSCIFAAASGVRVKLSIAIFCHDSARSCRLLRVWDGDTWGIGTVSPEVHPNENGSLAETGLVAIGSSVTTCTSTPSFECENHQAHDGSYLCYHDDSNPP
jgi:hypothetical protein